MALTSADLRPELSLYFCFNLPCNDGLTLILTLGLNILIHDLFTFFIFLNQRKTNKMLLRKFKIQFYEISDDCTPCNLALFITLIIRALVEKQNNMEFN